MKIKRPKKKDLKQSVLDEDALKKIVGLCVDLLYISGINTGDEDDESLLEIFDTDSLCGQYLSLEDFLNASNEERLRERIIMHIIVPEIIRAYESNTSTRGPHKRGLREFFEDLTEEKYNLYDVFAEYGLQQSTLKNHRQIDPFKDDDNYGLTHIRDHYIWRDPSIKR